MTIVAALFVDPKGCYAGQPGVELWDESRDARLYPGPHPVVAHPPCTRWCRLAGLVEARWGHKRGEDGGCFASALASVRKWGGVLEHPAYSDAWAAFDLPRPLRGGGWQRGACGGWSCHVEQGRYGHPAKKATWLYAFGTSLPELRWGQATGGALVSWCGNHVAPDEQRRRVGKRVAAATPPEFRDVLIELARGARVAPIGLLLLAALLWSPMAMAQIAHTKHGLSLGSRPDATCTVCHPPHRGGQAKGRSWPQTTAISSSSRRCLGCHDGSIGSAALGLSADGDHPVGIPYAGEPGSLAIADGAIGNYYATQAGPACDSGGTCTTGPNGVAIELFVTDGVARVECDSCHEPHGVYGNPDFLRVTTERSALCLACHRK